MGSVRKSEYCRLRQSYFPHCGPFIIALLTLTACMPAHQPPSTTTGPTAAPPSGSYPTGLDNTCDGERYGTLVGQDATALERVLIMGQVRVLRPGSIVTQDYRPERLNFEIGERNQIARITCG